MAKILKAAKMCRVQRMAINRAKVTKSVLIDRKAAVVVDEITKEWPVMLQGLGYVVVLCGPGQTGCIGFGIAEILDKLDFGVQVWFCDEPDSLTEEAKAGYAKLAHDKMETWKKCGDLQDEMSAFSMAWNLGVEEVLIIDALFGAELARPIPMYWRETIGNLGSSGKGGFPKYVAVELPSGFDADSGSIIDWTKQEIEEDGYVIEMSVDHFDLTVAFHAKLPGHQLAPCVNHCGRLVIRDIGL